MSLSQRDRSRRCDDRVCGEIDAPGTAAGCACELADRVDLTVVNLSILKNGRARAIRFSTLTALCEALDCQPGDLLTHEE